MNCPDATAHVRALLEHCHVPTRLRQVAGGDQPGESPAGDDDICHTLQFERPGQEGATRDRTTLGCPVHGERHGDDCGVSRPHRTACGAEPDSTADRCPDCGGVLVGDYDVPDLTPEALPDVTGPGRYEPLRPFSGDATVTLDEGATPLVPVPELADELGVDSVYVKDEGRNPTASLGDRKLSLAVTAAAQRGAERVATPSTGNGAQANAAYAARAGIGRSASSPRAPVPQQGDGERPRRRHARRRGPV